MRYLLIDRITEWKAGQKIKGVKNVAMTEDFLEWHFPKNPVMPGVLLIEAFAQLSGMVGGCVLRLQKLVLDHEGSTMQILRVCPSRRSG